MNDELTTQTTAAPIVLKLKKFDDHHPNVVLPHTSHSSVETIDDSNSISSSLLRNDETSTIIPNHSSPSTLRVKLKTSFLNGTADHSDDEYPNSSLTEILTRPAKRCKNSTSTDFNSPLASTDDAMNDSLSSQHETGKFIREVKQDYEPLTSSPLVLKIRRNSLTTTILQTNSSSGISSIGENDSNRQLLIKFKKNEYGDIVNSQTSMSTEYLLAEQIGSNNNDQLMNNSEMIHTNGHHDLLYKPVPIQTSSVSSSSPPITNMLANLNDHSQTPSHLVMNNHFSQVPAVSILSTSNQTAETHTKELLDEALDSVKNVLMQTFKKNLESGGDLNDLKTTLGSDEVAEVFLAKLRQSLKRETTSIVDNIESKPVETSMETDTHRCETPSAMISPVMNVVLSPSSSSSSLLPPVSTMINKTSSPSPSMILPSSPQSQTTPNTNNKRKSSTPSTNPNRFDGTTEEELSKRLLSDILQPNLDIVFVGINPSLYAVHKGHHYGGPGNHFWKLLHMSALIPTAFTANDDYRMPQYGIGFTNIVQRPSKAGSDITKDEITAGAEVLLQKIKMFRPKIVAFNGRGIYEVYAGNKHFHYGKQPEPFPGTDTHVFVMPSSSARCSQLPRAEDKLPFYVGLRKLRDFVNGSLHSLNEAEITFPDIKIKDTDDVLQKTIIRISNKPFSELSAETLKPFGDKIPSGQMVSKHISSTSQQTMCSSPSPSSSSSSNLVFNTDALTTQTMSILHNTTIEQNNNLLTYDQQAQRVYLQNDGHYSPSPPPSTTASHSSTSVTVQSQRLLTNGVMPSKSSFLENSSPNTNAAVLAALASGGHNSSSTFYQPTQTVYLSGVGGQQQTVSYSTSSINNSTSVINVRSSAVSATTTAGTMVNTSGGNIGVGSSTSSHVIHHHPNSTSSSESSNSSVHLSSSTASAITRPMVVVNSSETLSSLEMILHSQTTNSSSSFSIRTPVAANSTKDLLSSQSSASKSTLILVPPTNKPNVVLPKLSKISNNVSMDKRTNDDCLFVRYERESSTNNTDQYRFSFIIDEHSTSMQKRSRYVSINDL